MAVDAQAMASRMIGIPFADGGRDARTGLDCYGLLLHVYNELGWSLPDPFTYDDGEGMARLAYALWEESEVLWEEVDEPRFGDALVMSGRLHPKGHVAVYLDEQHVLNTRRGGTVFCLPFTRMKHLVSEVLRLVPARRESAT